MSTDLVAFNATAYKIQLFKAVYTINILIATLLNSVQLARWARCWQRIQIFINVSRVNLAKLAAAGRLQSAMQVNSPWYSCANLCFKSICLARTRENYYVWRTNFFPPRIGCNCRIAAHFKRRCADWISNWLSPRSVNHLINLHT